MSPDQFLFTLIFSSVWLLAFLLALISISIRVLDLADRIGAAVQFREKVDEYAKAT